MSEVVILCGVSGSGKTTLCKKEFPAHIVVSADTYFTHPDGSYHFDAKKLHHAHNACGRTFLMMLLLASGPLDIVVDNTNTEICEIAPYAQVALWTYSKLRIIILRVDPKIAASRNLHGVPESTIIAQSKRLETVSEQFPRWWPKPEFRDS
jgi:predicted kinase